MAVGFPTRKRIELAGKWAFLPLAWTEFDDDGLHERTAALPEGGAMEIPSNWHVAGLPGFHGRVAYSRDLPAVEGQGWWLCFEGSDYITEVLIDGLKRIRHEGAFDPFSLPLPPGAKSVEVIVDAPTERLGSLWPFRKRQFKGIFTQWAPFETFQETTGGIWGAVYLEQRPDPYIDSVRVTTFLVPRAEVVESNYRGDRDLIEVEAGPIDALVLLEVDVCSSLGCTAELVASLCDETTSKVLTLEAGRTRHALSLTVRDPLLWWSWDRGSPVLHWLSVSLGEDVYRDRVGIREVRFDEGTGRFALNGVDVAVRGSNVVPEKWLSQYTRERAESDVHLIREANLNAVRVCVHVAAEAFYDACDEQGVLIWQDMPMQWWYSTSGDLVLNAADQAGRVVQRLHNHPSIMLWSCLNEPFPVHRANYAGAMVRAIRYIDGTRPVHESSDFSEHLYPGWYRGHVEEYRALGSAAGTGGQVPLVTEFGAQAFPSADEVRELGGLDWPPAGAAWGQLLYEAVPTLDVAGLEIGPSLESFVEQSQRYQAHVVQTATEALRLGRKNYFHFQFMDGWPAVSWSVVSYKRVRKLGYTALARASQPVLVGVNLLRRIVSDNHDTERRPLFDTLWVVNDLPSSFPGSTWRALLDGHLVGEGKIDVAPSGVSSWSPSFDRIRCWDVPPVSPGTVQLSLELYNSTGELISSNAYEVEVIDRGLKESLWPGGRLLASRTSEAASATISKEASLAIRRQAGQEGQ